MNAESVMPAAEPAVLSSREQLLAPRKRRYRHVTLPVSGLVVRIQSLTEGEQSRYAARLTLNRDKRDFQERVAAGRRSLFVLCLVDGNGNRLLMDCDQEQLADWDNADCTVLFDAVVEHCGMKADEVEAAVKNSERIDGGA